MKDVLPEEEDLQQKLKELWEMYIDYCYNIGTYTNTKEIKKHFLKAIRNHINDDGEII